MDAAKALVKFVNISPLKSDLIDEVHGDWLAPRPNTDVAIMFGLAHTLHIEGLANKTFIELYTTGYERFIPYLLGESDGIAKSAEWASEISEVPAETIRTLARQMASQRTMISVSWSLTRQDHGEQPFWAAIMLASMLGQIGLPGGGFGFGYSATNYIGGDFSVLPITALPQAKNVIKSFIPVARISDMLLHPVERFDFDGVEY